MISYDLGIGLALYKAKKITLIQLILGVISYYKIAFLAILGIFFWRKFKKKRK